MTKSKKEKKCFVCDDLISDHTLKNIEECSNFLINKAIQALGNSKRLFELAKELKK